MLFCGSYRYLVDRIELMASKWFLLMFLQIGLQVASRRDALPAALKRLMPAVAGWGGTATAADARGRSSQDATGRRVHVTPFNSH